MNLRGKILLAISLGGLIMAYTQGMGPWWEQIQGQINRGKATGAITGKQGQDIAYGGAMGAVESVYNAERAGRQQAFQEEQSNRNYALQTEAINAQERGANAQLYTTLGLGGAYLTKDAWMPAVKSGVDMVSQAISGGPQAIAAAGGDAAALESSINAVGGGAAAGGSLTAAGGWGGAAGFAGGKAAQPIGQALGVGGQAERGAVGGALAGAAAGAAATAWSGPGAIVGGAIGGIVGLATNTWICTEIDKRFELSGKQKDALSLLRRYTIKYHRSDAKAYLKNGHTLTTAINKDGAAYCLYWMLKEVLVNGCCKLVEAGNMPSAYEHYKEVTQDLCNRYNVDLYEEHTGGNATWNEELQAE